MAWNIDDFRLDDQINREIWEQSPALQREVHAQTDDNGDLLFDGSYGCQQAMLGNEGFDENPLPWVPDLVGKDYGAKGSILIVGSAYAPFIRGYGGKRSAIPRLAYRWASATHPANFQQLFFDEVVSPDIDYYSKIEQLLSGCGEGSLHPRMFCLTDLCNGSFVQRRVVEVNPRPHEPHYFSYEIERRDAGGDRVVRRGRSVFHEYVSYGDSRRWLWNRISHGRVKAILALGSIAEHGVLKLMTGEGCSAETTHGETFAGGSLNEANPNGNWVGHYAHHNWRLGDWAQRVDSYWRITQARREWRLLPVQHPSRHGTYWTDDYLAAIRDRIRLLLQ